MISTSQPDSPHPALPHLHEIYTFTHAHFLDAKHDYECFHLRLQSLAIPSSGWPPSMSRHHALLKKSCHTNLKLFLSAAKSLRLAQQPHSAVPKPASPKPAAAPKPEPPVKPEPPAKPEPRIYKHILDQTLYIRTIDGQTVTRFSINAARWMEINAWDTAGSFHRQYAFEDGVVPPEYSFVLEHKGDLYPTTKNIFISYEPEDFKRICQLEVETQSPHGLDGPRRGYYHHEKVQPIGKAPAK